MDPANLKPYCGDSKIDIAISKNDQINEAIERIKYRKPIIIGKELITGIYKFQLDNIKLKDLPDLNEVIGSKSWTKEVDPEDDFYLSFESHANSNLKLASLQRSKTEGHQSNTILQKSSGRTLEKAKSERAYIPPSSLGAEVRVNNHTMLLLRFGNEVIACQSRCPHKGAELQLGDIECLPNGNRLLKCPWHNFTFNLDRGGQKVYPKEQMMHVNLSMFDAESSGSGDIQVNMNTFDLDESL